MSNIFRVKSNKDRIIDYIVANQEKSVSEMARDLNVSKSTIYKYLREFNAKAPYHNGYNSYISVLAYVDKDLRQIVIHPYSI